MYANSRFMAEINEWGRVTKWIEPGEEIKQSDLNVSDAEWQSLIDAGVVVESYPKGLGKLTPPAEYYKNNPEELPEDNSAVEVGQQEEQQTVTEEQQQQQQGEPKKPWQK